MELYSAIKSNTFESVLMRWMNLEPITQSEVSQTDKDKYHIISLTCGILKKKKDRNELIYKTEIDS